MFGDLTEDLHHTVYMVAMTTKCCKYFLENFGGLTEDLHHVHCGRRLSFVSFVRKFLRILQKTCIIYMVAIKFR
jgi:hypothetical protein